MVREISILIVEDDIYARYWMEMMLRRDWRTRVVGQVDNAVSLYEALSEIHDSK